MAEDRKRQGKSGRVHSSDTASFDLIDSIRQLADAGAVDKPYLTYDELLFSFQRWWCHYYKRPYKDPLLASYTLEELAFEYYDITAADRLAAHKKALAEAVPQEEYDWAEEEERKEREEEAKRAYAEPAEPEQLPVLQSDTIVEENVAATSDEDWAKKHIPEKVLSNPTADQVDDQDGDIQASFGER